MEAAELKSAHEAKLVLEVALKRADPTATLNDVYVGTITETRHLYKLCKHPCYATMSYTCDDISYELTVRANTEPLALHKLVERLIRHVYD